MIKCLTQLDCYLYKKSFKLGALSRPQKKTIKELKRIANRLCI